MRWRRPQAMKGRRLPELPRRRWALRAKVSRQARMRLMKAPRAESHLPKAPMRLLRLVIRRQRTLLATRPPKREPWIWEPSMRLPRRPLLLLQKRRRTMPQRPMRRLTMPLLRRQARLLVLTRQHPMLLAEGAGTNVVVSAAKVEHRAMHHPNPTLRQTLTLPQMLQQSRAMRPTKMPARPRARRSRLRQQVAAGSKEKRGKASASDSALHEARNLPRVSMLTLRQGKMIVRMKTNRRLLGPDSKPNSSRDPATSMDESAATEQRPACPWNQLMN